MGKKPWNDGTCPENLLFSPNVEFLDVISRSWITHQQFVRGPVVPRSVNFGDCGCRCRYNLCQVEDRSNCILECDFRIKG